MGEYARWYLEGFAWMVENPRAVTTAVADVTGAPAKTSEQRAAAKAGASR